MKNYTWMLLILITSSNIKAEENAQSSMFKEVFCSDGASLFFISADNDVTSPSTNSRLRILRSQDGKLLLYIEEQLIYPFVPNITPVFLSEENGAIMLPDLQKQGASIGLQMPEGLDVVVIELLHQIPPPTNVKVLSQAEVLATRLVHRAKTMGDLIEQKAAKLQSGLPAAPGSHTRLRAGAHYARTATDHVVDATSWATNLVGQATERVGQVVRPMLPMTKKQTDASKNTGNNNPPNKITDSSNNIATVGIEALDKITNALKTSAKILTTSLRENTVHVVQYKLGEDMGDAVGDVIESAKNTMKAVYQVRDLRPKNIVQKVVRQIATGAVQQHTGKSTSQYTCTDDL